MLTSYLLRLTTLPWFQKACFLPRVSVFYASEYVGDKATMCGSCGWHGIM